MSASTSLLVVVVVAVITYVMRAGVILALAGRAIPAPIERALRYVGPAVLAALAINLATAHEGEVGLSLAEAGGLVAAGVIAWRTRHIVASLAGAMAVLWLLTALS